MDSTTTIFKTIVEPSPEILFKDRKSKFFGYAFPLSEETDIKPIIEQLRKKHPNAGHFCYAWQLGLENQRYRVNDDGEPKNSSGMPIYGQIKSFGLTNCFIVVVRIYGGVKLGVSGLINAYRTAAQMALNAAKIEQRTIETCLELGFEYPLMNDVMRALKKMQVRMISQKMEHTCRIRIAIPKNKSAKIQSELRNIHQLKITLL